MKEEHAPICFQPKLARRHRPHGRSSGIFITPALGATFQLSQLTLPTLLLSFQVSLPQVPGKVPAEGLMVS